MADLLPETIKFFYLKNPQFRVIHVDGALGGITPKGLIHLAVYSERPAIPVATVQEITAEGALGDVHGSEGKEGIVREIDVDMIFTRETAIELREWLTKQINKLAELEAMAPNPRKEK